MFDTNVIKHSNLLRTLQQNNLTDRYFSVSTDKAANPVSLMGASKKIMELVLQCKHYEFDINIKTSTTRFANVAFSNGSLLQSFSTRFEKREPLPAPFEIKRFFVSHKEAAQICILSSSALEGGDILVPKINQEFSLYPIINVAKNFIESKDMTPVVVESKEEAYEIIKKNKKGYPIVGTKADTSGEKEFEEFVGLEEKIVKSEFIKFDIVEHSDFDSEELIIFVNNFNLLLQGDVSISKTDLIKNINNIVKNLNHIETGENLDSRM
jgi:FlaA1/EpsC-like NDP-sugar epimerase